ncbi:MULTISPECIES: response regulator [Pelosinus]|jgi:two-component system response regulator (stage 0 sporulation protein F)|uniref:Response regulator receiver protein n=2 Tax=Pelosinus fermentans TaxID=365349 RepID=I9NW31_9FIRM|nr:MULTISPECIES: response regulator [Pelosinus]MBP2661062.1 response regulator receiver protein [Bacillota bacterium]AJQ29432.1 response regulator receiver protein [Pelosinus fermentans JBW45]EIW19613.1 response regulator receiver [Pelosinus fermentans B4]EIW24653.1 response regulator receiver protein [Pelosinus fermentans A11]OAM96066.1 response regulator receiver protein [Pelosinus fermentans DSM 17108]
MSNIKHTVLVIDDQPGIRRLLMEVLSEEGYAVHTAANGYEGIQKVKDLKPVLILMDMKMPGMDGIETLRELKRLNQANKVIMMTAYGELELVNIAKELGAYAYITKPFDIIDLCSMIATLISGNNKECELKIG